MKFDPTIKLRSLLNLYEILPENERIITDVLRQIIKENLPATCKERISYNVPFFMERKVFVLFGRLLFPGAELKKVSCWDFGMATNLRILTISLLMVPTNKYFTRSIILLKRSMKKRL